jgi:hypothetical protein
MDIKSLCDIVEKGIEKLGLSPDETRGEKLGQWDFVRGSAEIAVGVTITDRYPNGYFYVTSVLLEAKKVPAAKREQFYYSLLETNASLVNMQLALNNDWLLLISNRDAKGLDFVEVAIAVSELSYYADELDDQMKNSFTTRV